MPSAPAGARLTGPRRTKFRCCLMPGPEELPVSWSCCVIARDAKTSTTCGRASMEVDDLLAHRGRRSSLGLPRYRKATLRSLQKDGLCGWPTSQPEKAIFREAALKHVALLQRSRYAARKRDHAIGEEFFHDILDEHFSEEEVRAPVGDRTDWGRYAEIFDYDSNTGDFSYLNPLEAATVPRQHFAMKQAR